MRHKFLSIEEKGGLKAHLNQTRHLHRGFGYKTFRILRVAKLNKTNMARAFNVTFDTLKDWLAIDDKEQEARRLKAETETEEMRERLK